MAFKPDFIKELPAPLQAPAGEAFEWGRNRIEEKLQDYLGINEVDVFGGQEDATAYWDPTVSAVRKEQLLYIQHVASKKSIGLFAMMSSLTNNYSVNWSTEDVYGRQDPIPGYQNTRRTITVNFKVVSANLAEAKFNYEKTLGRGGCERVSLNNMFYPTYKEISGYKTIASPPLMAIKHMQLLQSFGRVVEGGYLVGYITNSSINPKFDSGVFEESIKSEREDVDAYHFMYPKVIDISFTFNVLHDYDMGWKASTGFLAELFPEIGSGEDIGRFLGCKIGGTNGALLGSMLGGGVDDLVNATFGYDENEAGDDGYAPGNPAVVGVVPSLMNAGVGAIFGP